MPVLLDWFVKKSKEPDSVIKDDSPAPTKLKGYIEKKILEHPGYQARLNKKESKK